MVHEKDKPAIEYILELVEKAIRIINGYSHDDVLVKFSIARIIEIVGERTKPITYATKNFHPNFPWLTIERLRDLLNHSHCQLVYKEAHVYSLIFQDLAELRDRMAAIAVDTVATEGDERRPYPINLNGLAELNLDDGKGLNNFREAAKQLLVERVNAEHLTTTDLALLKSRSRLPKLDLAIIREEAAHIVEFLNRLQDNSDPLYREMTLLALQHSFGILGQSAINIRDFHIDFYCLPEIYDLLHFYVYIRNKQLHARDTNDDGDTLLNFKPRMQLLLEELDRLDDGLDEKLSQFFEKPVEKMKKESQTKNDEKTKAENKNLAFFAEFRELEEIEESIEKDTSKHYYGYTSDDSDIVESYKTRTPVERMDFEIDQILDEYRARQVDTKMMKEKTKRLEKSKKHKSEDLSKESESQAGFGLGSSP